MRDITSPDDVKLLVDSFYEKVKKDVTIGNIFHRIIGEDWSHHLPVMYSFWESILLNKVGYTGNPMQKHVAINQKIPLNNEHYTRWLQLWVQTVNSLYEGDNANNAIRRAEAIMGLIRMKIEASKNGNSLL